MKNIRSLPWHFWTTKILLLAVIAALSFFYRQTDKRFEAVSRDLAELSRDLATTTEILIQDIKKTEEETKGLSETISKTGEKVGDIGSKVGSITDELGGFKSEVGKISGSVGVLEKLVKTDPELLQKYSKIFFLNEHYQPERLVEIEKKYIYNENQTLTLHVSVYPYLVQLFDAAGVDGKIIYAKSAFRSFEEQLNTKTSYTVIYGSGTANQFSADQGYSEHQLGTTVDFITTGIGGSLPGFDHTDAFTWLLENAYKYGFILSYPEGNSYYIFEPWHWRFVGVELAKFLHDSGKNFYDLDQREIDEYLVKIFD